MAKVYHLLMVLLAFSCDIGESAKFLLPATSLVSMPSHYMGLTTITQALVEKGHEVVLLIIDKKETKGFLPGSYTANITFPNPMTEAEVERMNNIRRTAMTVMKNITILATLTDPLTKEFHELIYFGCFELFKNEDILQKLKQERFDMILTFPVTDFCDAVISAYLDVPYIIVSGTRRLPAFHEDMIGIPIPNSFVPFSMFTPSFSDRMTFLERVQNAVFHYVFHAAMEYMISHRPIGQLQRTYGIRPDLTPQQMISKAQLWLCHNTWALEYPRPIGPNWIPIAGYTIKDPKPLPKNLEEFVQGSGEHGFIVFTLGSMTTSFASDAINDMFSKVFSNLPQRVIWRYVGPTPRYLGNNTLVADWLPQNDLLAHPKARLLIYHGGSAGVHEAITYGVPMLLMPLAGDQDMNAHLVEAKGMGLQLDVNALDEETIRATLRTLLQNESYKTNAMKASGILRDRLASPLDTAVFWIEHVIKYGGDHLRLRSTEMGFIQLNSLDVVAFLVVLSLILIYIDYLLIRGCYRCICRKTEKQKRD